MSGFNSNKRSHSAFGAQQSNQTPTSMSSAPSMNGGLKRNGVSSFSMSGLNNHNPAPSVFGAGASPQTLASTSFGAPAVPRNTGFGFTNMSPAAAVTPVPRNCGSSFNMAGASQSISGGNQTPTLTSGSWHSNNIPKVAFGTPTPSGVSQNNSFPKPTSLNNGFSTPNVQNNAFPNQVISSNHISNQATAHNPISTQTPASKDIEMCDVGFDSGYSSGHSPKRDKSKRKDASWSSKMVNKGAKLARTLTGMKRHRKKIVAEEAKCREAYGLGREARQKELKTVMARVHELEAENQQLRQYGQEQNTEAEQARKEKQELIVEAEEAFAYRKKEWEAERTALQDRLAKNTQKTLEYKIKADKPRKALAAEREVTKKLREDKHKNEQMIAELQLTNIDQRHTIEKARTEIDSLHQDYSAIWQNWHELDNQNLRLDMANEVLRNETQSLKEDLALKVIVVAALKSQKSTLRSTIRSLQMDCSQQERRIASLETDVERLKFAKTENEDYLQVINRLGKKIKELEASKKALGSENRDLVEKLDKTHAKHTDTLHNECQSCKDLSKRLIGRDHLLAQLTDGHCNMAMEFAEVKGGLIDAQKMLANKKKEILKIKKELDGANENFEMAWQLIKDCGHCGMDDGQV